jgi:hypothetical protein
MTGSYHNYFRIYDAEGGGGPSGEITLQADKSAFKAKKIGGPPGRPGVANRANGKKEVISTEGIDFNKKILHGSWHPREPTIAIAGQSIFYVAICCRYANEVFHLRFPQRPIICSSSLQSSIRVVSTYPTPSDIDVRLAPPHLKPPLS